MSNASKPDLVVVNPASRTQVYQSLGAHLSAIEPPVWAGLLTTFIRLKGFAVELVDAEAHDLTPRQVAERVSELDPLLTVVVVYGHQPSASTQNMPAASQVCNALKEWAPESKVLLLGGHVAALPEQTLREEKADFVSGGEGPYTVQGLLQALRLPQPNYSQVPDLWYREDDAVRHTPPSPLVKELDREMPQLPWDLLPMEKYRAHNWHCLGNLERQPYAAFYTTLGCPYRCTFCCIQAPFKGGEKALGYKDSVNSYRFWSPRSVVDQIGALVERYGVRNIKIADEMFVLNPRHVSAVCDLIIERGYDLNIWAYARVDTVKDGMLDKLRRAGFNWLAFGIEAASERVRGDVQKGFGQEEIYKTIEAVRKAGINVIGNYIFGLPEDDLNTMQQTLDMAMDLNCEFANFYSAMAYPGSQLYRVALKEGWPLPSAWSGYSQHSVDTLPLPTKYLTAAEVLRFRDHAFEVYFTSSRYLDKVTQKFGAAAAQHIQGMASHRLVRRHL
jgi:radical SAM superfamily enzyme YgiQ (UPF0313 family)